MVGRPFRQGHRPAPVRKGEELDDEPEDRSEELLALARTKDDLQAVVEVPDGVDDDAPDSLRVPPPGWRSSDVALLSTISERYAELAEVLSGLTVTVEPGIYIAGLGGVRVEDDILVTEDGAEVLTDYPKDKWILG